MAWEADFLLALQNIRTPFLDTLMGLFSMIGDRGICSIALALILMIFIKTRRTGIEVLLSVALAFVFANLIIKNVVARPRPYEAYTFLEALVRKPHDSSFPSGHTTNVFAAATAVFLNHKKVGVIALIIAALVGFSRMYNCMHYPTDVLAGVVIGVGFAVLVHYVIYPACDNRLKARKESR